MATKDDTCFNAPAAVVTLDESIGALTLAYDAVFAEAGANQTLAHAFACMAMALRNLDQLRDTLADALDADQAAAQMNVTARWLEDSARAGIIPHIKLGKFTRFRVSEIAAHCRVEGAPMPGSTDNQSVTPIRRLLRQ